MTSSTTRGRSPERTDGVSGHATPARLWFGILGAPAAWAIQLVVSDGLTELGCAHTGTTVLNVLTVGLTIATACIALAALVVSAVAWRSSRTSGNPHVERAAFMSVVGMFSSAIFLFLILMGGLVPHVFLETCAR